jgi:hypothetical protein
VYDEIADVLVAAAERMASWGSVAESGTSLKASGPRRLRGAKGAVRAVIISSGVLVPAEICRLVGSWRAEQEHQ